MKPKRFACPQPFALLARKDGLSISKLAGAIGVSPAHLMKVATGYTAPPQGLRDKLVAYFDLPVEMLICPASLVTSYQPGHATRLR